MNDLFFSVFPLAFENLQEKLRLFIEQQKKINAAAASDSGEWPIQKQDKTGIIQLRGPMLKDAPAWVAKYGLTSTAKVRQALTRAAADSSIENIILWIDSPGGSVDGIAELADAIFEVRQSKPVLAQVEGMAASAAYYVGSQAEKIYAGRSDLIGSIGVRLMLYDFSRMFENAGIKPIPIDTGKYKSAGALGTEITEEQQADFQRIVDGYFADFKDAVLRGRPRLRGGFDDIADGRVFQSREAIGLGLIDGIQTIEETLEQFRPKTRTRRANAAARIQKQTITLREV